MADRAEQAEKSELELEQVCERLQELEKRVAALERGAAPAASAPVETFLGIKQPGKEKRAGSTNVAAVLGKAVLAIAGAYLLRAIAESGALPRMAMLAAGVVYAGGWLVWAVRSHRRSGFASTILGLTTAAILAPLLWEGTVRFHVLTAGTASAVLVGYVVLSLGLAWKEKLEAIPWIATTAAAGAALALIVATHELRALTVALLAMALATEVAAWSGRWLGLRLVTAVAADFAVGVLGMVMTAAGGVPAGYRAMSAGEVNAFCVGLMVIYGGSLGVRGFGMGRKWTFGEIAQAAIAFALGTWMSLRATHGGSAAALGAVFLALAVVCYWGALRRFAGRESEGLVPEGGGKGAGIKASATTREDGEEAGADGLSRPSLQTQEGGVKPPLHEDGVGLRRNRRVSASYAAGLVLAGSYLLMGGNLQVVLLSVAAVAAVFVFTRTGYVSLGIHGTLYLLAAGVVCGLFGYAGRALAGTVPAWPEWSFWAVALAGLASYVVGSRASGDGWKARILWVVPAAVVAFAVAALVVAGTAGLRVAELNASRLSMVRTAVTCVMALGLGYAGSRWNRVELGWLAYGAIGLGALKLVAEDLRFGNAGTLMMSLLFYGLVLVLLPRVTRFGRVEV
jgi:hypothetical protein